jgi:3-hydroxybutyryl-CoA dehydrogenase
MTIVVAASDEQWNELSRPVNNIDWQRVEDAKDFAEHTHADAFFSLKDNRILAEFGSFKKPVLINSVVETLADLEAPGNVLRINGWATFLSRPVWEIAGAVDDNSRAVFNSLNITINTVKDEPGFISARVIAMIINEAYFAVEDNVSSKQEIDTAMKLGTNYPHGPFEWAQMIGTNNILALLQKLSTTDTRYQPSELLIKEASENSQ